MKQNGVDFILTDTSTYHKYPFPANISSCTICYLCVTDIVHVHICIVLYIYCIVCIVYILYCIYCIYIVLYILYCFSLSSSPLL